MTGLDEAQGGGGVDEPAGVAPQLCERPRVKFGRQVRLRQRQVEVGEPLHGVDEVGGGLADGIGKLA